MRSRKLSLALAFFAAIACSASNPEADTTLPSAVPDIVGTVTAVNGNQVRVEENSADASGSAKASVRIVPGETRIARRSGAPATIADITPGTRVSVWFVGPVMESYPVQARGAVFVIE